jgi:hypothetical protein
MMKHKSPEEKTEETVPQGRGAPLKVRRRHASADTKPLASKPAPTATVWHACHLRVSQLLWKSLQAAYAGSKPKHTNVAVLCRLTFENGYTTMPLGFGQPLSTYQNMLNNCRIACDGHMKMSDFQVTATTYSGAYAVSVYEVLASRLTKLTPPSKPTPSTTK